MFKNIKLSVDVVHFWLLFPKIGRNFIQFSGHTEVKAALVPFDLVSIEL
jgi:hypothetical protein